MLHAMKKILVLYASQSERLFKKKNLDSSASLRSSLLLKPKYSITDTVLVVPDRITLAPYRSEK